MNITDINVNRYKNKEQDSYVGEILIITVKTDTTHEGIGFTSAQPGLGEIYALIISQILKPVIVGKNAMHNKDLWTSMYNAVPRRGGDGILRNCIASIDFALWDLKGKAANVPVAALFGGVRDLIPTYANCAHHMPAKELAKRAASYVENGHKALKIRGTKSFVTPEEATRRVREVRAAIGPDVKLMVDVNGSWDVDTAIQQLKAWEPYNVYWLEEPVDPVDIPGYARVRARAGQTYIVGGEQHVGLLEHRHLIDHGHIDMVQPNAAMTGGITDWLHIHAYATARNIPVSPWDLQMVHLHLAAGLPNIKWIEYFMADNALLEFQTKLFSKTEQQEVVKDDGVYLAAPKLPGLGIGIDFAFAEKSLIS